MKKTIFVKYSNERSEAFAIRTDIYQMDSQKKVKKSPCSEKAEIHVRNIYRWFRELEKLYAESGLKINQCERIDSSVEMEYLEGQTLEEILDGYVARKEYDKLEECLETYLSILTKAAQDEFRPTEEFRKVFGPVPELTHMKSAAVTDIDMVLNNVIVCQGWNLIDYEWTFDFPIPVEYVVYRVLHYYFETTGARNEILRERKIYEKFGLSEERRRIFAGMERNFQQYIIQGYEPLRVMYPKITPGVISVADTVEMYRRQMFDNLQVFWSKDHAMCEENSRRFSSSDGNSVQCSMTFAEQTGCIRLDPGENPCVVQIRRFCVNGRELSPEMYTTNGVYLGEGLYLFEHQDPNVFYEEKYIQTMDLEWLVTPIAGGILDVVKTLNQRYRKQEQRIQQQQEKAESLQNMIDEQNEVIKAKNQIIEQKQSLIREMENTKVWRAYRKYRQLWEQKKE